jgi:hypothetical protein
MSDEPSLFEDGYEAVIRAVARDEGALNVDVLAQACSRKARAPGAPREESLGWARACIDCYRKAAAGRMPGHDRQGSEVPSFGLRALMILRWGPEVGSSVLDPDDLQRWIQEELDAHASPAVFREALERTDGSQQEREHAFCLKERLEVGLPLFEKGLLSRSLGPWLRVAGLLRDAL